jgi:RNA polymerase sigma factor (sigma-70 family)
MSRAPVDSPYAFLPPQLVSLKDVVISDQLISRRLRKLHGRNEIKAMYELASLLGGKGVSVLKRLAQMAVELCDAGSGGISMIETGEDGEQFFRWQALAGEFERYEGGTTPRDWSPCGECLTVAKPALYSYPARFFTYFQKVDTPIVEGLVIPMYVAGLPIGTIWIISHNEQRHFDAEDVRIMTSLGSFVATALRLSCSRVTSFTEFGRNEQDVVWGELVRRIADGDSSALVTLIDETKPVVFGRALKILGLRADAEEITMDVYAHIWRTAGSYDPVRGGVLGWMFSIARSRAIDRLRSRARQERAKEDLYFECSSASGADDFVASSEIKRNVHRALEALPFEQRRAIKLAYFSGYSMTEVALHLGHPLGTVKSRIRCGLIRMRRLIATTESYGPHAHLG